MCNSLVIMSFSFLLKQWFSKNLMNAMQPLIRNIHINATVHAMSFFCWHSVFSYTYGIHKVSSNFKVKDLEPCSKGSSQTITLMTRSFLSVLLYIPRPRPSKFAVSSGLVSSIPLPTYSNVESFTYIFFICLIAMSLAYNCYFYSSLSLFLWRGS